ncbi:TY-Chap domain-containing protein [Bernardetia sp.]|uniref:TY-Chap domain-containing protein n=1 Tax=Bernardetia sp. TaxID=1937974 RepID=UPI0025BD018F|nr:hypothetical protein [Bernardetia sp.]
MESVLHSFLKRLIEEGGTQNFLIINLSKSYYIQVAGEFYSSHLFFEAVSNNFLPTKNQLSSSQHQRLLTLGWNSPTKEGNYTYKTSINSSEEYNACIEFVEKTAKEIYGIDVIDEFMIELNLE